MLGKKRRGMALIYIVLISALVLVSIIGIAIKVVPETKIIASQSASQRAFLAAESGLSQVLFNLRNDGVVPSGSSNEAISYLKFQDIVNADTNTNPKPSFLLSEEPITLSEASATPYVTYQVKIVKQAGIPPTPQNQLISMTLDIYSLGTVYDSRSEINVLARKVIFSTVKYIGSKNLTLGILAGGNIDFSGSSNVVGDVFANGSITNSGGGSDYRVYGSAFSAAGGSIPDGTAQYGQYTGVAPINIASLFAPYTKDLAWAFKTGAYPYNGVVDNFTDPDGDGKSNYPVVVPGSKLYDIMRQPQYLKCDNEEVDKESGDSLEAIHMFYNDLMNATGTPGGIGPLWERFTFDEMEVLKEQARNIAYYCNLDYYYSSNVFKFTGNTISDFGDGGKYYIDPITGDEVNYLSFGGILIIDGNLSLESNKAIGRLVDEDGHYAINLTFIVLGSTEVKTVGSAVFNGLLYSENGIEVTAGSFEVNGGIITQGSINVRGSSEIVYNDVGGLNQLKLEPIIQADGTSWAEKPYDENFWK